MIAEDSIRSSDFWFTGELAISAERAWTDKGIKQRLN
jgi:hypothetical protein